MFISNLGMKEPILAVGVDKMQAILLAFEGGFGRKFAENLESMIDRETDKFGSAARRRHFRNLKKGAGPQ